MSLDLNRHPCFSDSARGRHGRVHLPVAPKCNVQCLFCDRRYDCANESRPGVTSVVVTPGQALAYLDELAAADERISVVGIAGPGDPLANPEATLETLRRVREAYPEMLLCVATNGLALPRYADKLAREQVSHVTVTVNAVEPDIGAKIYAWVREDRRPLRNEAGAALLLERQLEGIRLLKAHGVTVKVNTIVVPGVNDGHCLDVAETVRAAGADVLNLIGLYPVEGSAFAQVEAPDDVTMRQLRMRAATILPQMSHCARCRADAAGLLAEGASQKTQAMLTRAASLPDEPGEDRPYVAVGSMEGVLINRHLGECESFWIFGERDGERTLVERRSAPPRGGGQTRWQALANALRDCRALLVNSAGPSPVAAMRKNGVRVLVSDGLIEPALDAVYAGREPRSPIQKRHSCGSGCGGDGMGCG